MFDFMLISSDRPAPIAAGTFGIDPRVPQLNLRHYQPTGCPSLEQFEARFQVANDPRAAHRAA